MTELAEPPRYVLGWKAYFGLAQTPGVWRGLDEWMRHRLRTIQLKQWRRGTTIHRELLAPGVSAKVARLMAALPERGASVKPAGGLKLVCCAYQGPRDARL